MESNYFSETKITGDNAEFRWQLVERERRDSINRWHHQNGFGNTKDKENAFQWYWKPTEWENTKAHCDVGYIYEKNGVGTMKDENRASFWYVQSAEARNGNRQNSLSYCYQDRIRTTKDEEEIFHWYLTSTE